MRVPSSPPCPTPLTRQGVHRPLLLVFPMPFREASTSGLPELLRTLHAQRPNAAKDPNAQPPSSGVGLMVLLHCIVLVLLFVGTITSNEARDFRDASAFLPNGGTLPTPFLTLSVVNIILYALFVLMSVIDGAWFLATNVRAHALSPPQPTPTHPIHAHAHARAHARTHARQVYVTGTGLGMGLASAVLTGGLTLLASLQIKESVFWVYLVAFVSATVVIALQLAIILSILVRGDSALLRAIRMSV